MKFAETWNLLEFDFWGDFVLIRLYSLCRETSTNKVTSQIWTGDIALTLYAPSTNDPCALFENVKQHDTSLHIALSMHIQTSKAQCFLEMVCNNVWWKYTMSLICVICHPCQGFLVRVVFSCVGKRRLEKKAQRWSLLSLVILTVNTVSGDVNRSRYLGGGGHSWYVA